MFSNQIKSIASLKTQYCNSSLLSARAAGELVSIVRLWANITPAQTALTLGPVWPGSVYLEIHPCRTFYTMRLNFAKIIVEV